MRKCIVVKKIFLLVVFLVVYIFFFAVFASAIPSYGKWFNPRILKTYIQPGHPRTIMMKHAFAEWSRVTQNKFAFRYVDSPKVAQIEVYFVKTIPNADREIGLTKTSRMNSGKITHAVIQIAERPVNGAKLRNDSVYTTMLHEIGHAMGMLEHSSDPKSVMYPVVNDAQEISKADLKRLAKIYGWE